MDKCFDMLKPGGQLAVFWTNHPNKAFDIFDMSGANSQVAVWGLDNHLQFFSTDLTESHRSFWCKAMSELKAMEHQLKAEVPELFKTLMDECTYFNGLNEKDGAGGLFRWLYIFSKG